MSFHSFPISSIFYNKAARQRQDLGDVSDLVNSIRAVGLLNPIIITSEGELIAGERRLSAARALGWTHIVVQFREELSDLEKERIEFDENARRLDLTWQERTLAVLRYHELSRGIEGPAWTQLDTAARMGFSEAWIKKTLRVARALREGDKLILSAPQFSVAYGICERQDARKQDSELEALNTLLNGGTVPGVSLHTVLSPETIDSLLDDLPPAPILNLDFIEWASTYSGPKFNLLHCDFPYGIEADDHDQGAAKSFGGYSDSEDVYWKLIEALHTHRDRLVTDSAHMLFWFSMKHYEKTCVALQVAGWKVNPTPLIWHRVDNSGILPDPRRMPRQVYETALLCSRGDRFLVRPKSNLVAAGNTKQWHMSEKPLPVLTHFMEMLVDGTTSFLDPTCGSGNSLIAAERFGARSVLGLEINPEFHNSATANWRQAHGNTSDDIEPHPAPPTNP